MTAPFFTWASQRCLFDKCLHMNAVGKKVLELLACDLLGVLRHVSGVPPRLYRRFPDSAHEFIDDRLLASFPQCQPCTAVVALAGCFAPTTASHGHAPIFATYCACQAVQRWRLLARFWSRCHIFLGDGLAHHVHGEPVGTALLSFWGDVLPATARVLGGATLLLLLLPLQDQRQRTSLHRVARGLWPRLVARTCGRDLWPRLVARTCGRDLWPGPVARTCGPDLA